MSPNTRLLFYALAAVVALIVLIARFKLHPFIALIAVSLVLGIATGMPFGNVVKALQDGVGGVLGFIAIVVALGTMLGKLMAESGAATRIATTLITLFGERRVHWAIMVVGFIVGIPVFFQVGFVLLIPLVFTIARKSGLSLVKIGIPLVAGLSVVHGMVPPHPAAMLAVGAYNADVGRTIAYAILVGLPTAALAGPIFASWIAPRIALPPENPIAAQFTGGTGGIALEMPSFGISLFTVLLPVILMVCASAADIALDPASTLRAGLDFAGGPIVALLVALLFSFWSLGYRQHFTRDQILKFANDCLAPTATILLVIGAGGGFNRVLLESGVGKAIADLALGSHTSPLLLAWSVAALIRVATGSATVAMTTSAGIVAPIAAVTPGTHAELLVLATGAGSLVLSHVNDSGFWLIKEFFNMTVPQTLKTWTVAETIIGVAGLGFTLLLSLMVGCAPRAQETRELSELLDLESKRNVHESDYGFASIEHDRGELQPGKSVANRARELCVTGGFDNARPGYDVAGGIDGKPGSDESGTSFQLQVSGIVACDIAGNNVLQGSVGHDRQAVGPNRCEVVALAWLRSGQVGYDWGFLPTPPCARHGNQGQRDRGPFH